MIKRGITPSHPSRPQQPAKQVPRRIFGKDVKNIIHAYHNKLNESGSKSMSKLIIEDKYDNTRKINPGHRNQSQKNIKQNDSRLREDSQRKYEDKNGSSGKKMKSIGESTSASPKSVTIKDYLKSKAPLAISQISSQLQIISPQMRQLVITWIIQAAHKISLKSETLFHCILMFDYILANYSMSNLSGMVVCLENLQLLALACLFISAKYEEIYPPTADQIIKVADYAYSKKKLIQMQANILLEQQFNLTYPTRFTFLSHSINEQEIHHSSKQKRMEHMAVFLLEISLLQMWYQASEEQLAQAALFLSKKVLRIPVQVLNKKIYQLAWKLMHSWKQRRNSTLCYIFDSDKYSFVGGIYLQEV